MRLGRKIGIAVLVGGFIFSALLVVQGCNYHFPDHVTCDNCAQQPPPPPVSPPGTPPVTPPVVPTLVYKNVANTIGGYCLRCHNGPGGNGGVNLANYKGVMEHVVPGNAAGSKLCTEVRDKLMPPGAPLSDKLGNDICKWIEQGAKES